MFCMCRENILRETRRAQRKGEATGFYRRILNSGQECGKMGNTVRVLDTTGRGPHMNNVETILYTKSKQSNPQPTDAQGTASSVICFHSTLSAPPFFPLSLGQSVAFLWYTRSRTVRDRVPVSYCTGRQVGDGAAGRCS